MTENKCLNQNYEPNLFIFVLNYRCLEEAMNSHVKLVVPDMSSHFGGLVTERARQAFKST